MLTHFVHSPFYFCLGSVSIRSAYIDKPVLQAVSLWLKY